MARSLAETLTDAAREAVETSEWERDQGTEPAASRRRTDPESGRDGETDAEEGVSEEPRADPPETAE